MTDKRPVCLTIGGSDSCGGAGIQADLRIFEAFGVKGCSVVTALTAQNPREILRIEPVSLGQIEAEIRAVFAYYDIAAVKTGMLVDAGHIAVISALLDEYHAGKPLVIDPVMGASSGGRLLNGGAEQTLREALIPLATLVTPNLDEAACWLGCAIQEPENDAHELAQRFGTSILLKGGHEAGNVLLDVLALPDGSSHAFSHSRMALNEDAAHGTGCRLASGITALLGLGNNLADSVDGAIKFLQKEL